MSKAFRERSLRDEGSGKGKGADKETMKKWNMDAKKGDKLEGDKNGIPKLLSKMNSGKGDSQDQDKNRDASQDFVKREQERRQTY